MKKGLIIIGIIILALILVILVFSLNKRMTKDDMVQEFYESKQEFINIKEYLTTEEDEIYISEGNYKNVIHRDDIKASFEYLFRKLEFTKVMQEVTDDGDKIIVFTKAIKQEEFMIIYSEKSMDFGIESQVIELDWYYGWIGY